MAAQTVERTAYSLCAYARACGAAHRKAMGKLLQTQKTRTSNANCRSKDARGDQTRSYDDNSAEIARHDAYGQETAQYNLTGKVKIHESVA